MEEYKLWDLVHITGKEGNLPFWLYSSLLSRDYIWDTVIGTSVSSCIYQAERYREMHIYHKDKSEIFFLSITYSYI